MKTHGLARRPCKHRNFLCTFLDKPEVPLNNSLAERAIRPALILRRNSQSNRSEQGTPTHAIPMSLYRTLRLRGPDPTKSITSALRTDLTAEKLPLLPAPTMAKGRKATTFSR